MIDGKMFLHAGARVRTLEKDLLDRDFMNRMAEANTVEDVLKILSETKYGDESVNFKDPYDYERVLSEQTTLLYKFLYDICPLKDAIDLFSLKYDYHNLKVLLKSKYLKKDLSYLMYDIGTIPASKITQYFNDEDYGKLSPQMSFGVRKIIDEFSSKEDPQIIDILLDHALYSQITDTLKKLDSPYLSELIKLMIDLANIRIFVRVKVQNKDKEFLESVLIKDGNLRFSVFTGSLPDSLDSFPDKIKHTGYSEKIREAIIEYLKDRSLTKLEKASDDIIMNQVKKGKYVSLGIEPIIGYMMAKETEIKNIRIIMVGKINNVSPGIIKERLRDTYV